jgi:predicted Zn-dependent peptidase
MYRRNILKNGLRVITVPKAGSLSVNLLVLVGAGTNYENKKINGLSHFVEHMCFKGTKRRPRAIDLSSELDALGAEYNAFTSREYTGYYVSCLPDKIDAALDILADMYLNPVFDPLEIEKEKGVIGEEIKRAYDNPSRRVQDSFVDLLYGRSPRGFKTLGSTETLARISREDFSAYRKKFYHAGNTVVVASGGLSSVATVKKIDRHFSDLAGGDVSTPEYEELKQGRPKLVLEYKKSEQTNMILGFRGFGEEDPDYFAAEVLAGVLGGTMSSRLWQKVREEMGAAYSINAFQAAYLNYGYFGIAGGVRSRQASEVVRVILAECGKLTSEGPEEAELARTKDSIVGTTYLSLETPADLGSFLGIQEVRGQKVMKPTEWGEGIRAVTASDVRRVAKRLFKTDALNLALLGPHKSKAEFEDILSL